MIRTRFIIILLFILVYSCKINHKKFVLNNNIPTNIRSQIEILDKQVIKALKTNNSDIFNKICSKEFLEIIDKDNVDSVINQAYIRLTEMDFEYKDQYYVTNTAKNVVSTVFSGFNDNDYIIVYKAVRRKIFISLLLSKDIKDKMLITSIYGKYYNKWKLITLQLGYYTLNDKNAIEYLERAESCYKKGYFIDANFNLLLGQEVLKPAGQIFQYRKEKEFLEFCDLIQSKIEKYYNFPITINTIETKPKIFYLNLESFKEGVFPMIKYYTNLDLKDTISLEKENLLIQKEIGEIFEGIDKNNTYLLYNTTNEYYQKTKRYVPYYGFVQEIK